MGTFQCSGFGSVQVTGGRGSLNPLTQGWCNFANGISTDEWLANGSTLEYLGPPTLTAFSASLIWDLIGTNQSFTLDGGASYDRFNLPKGILFTEVDITADTLAIHNGGGVTFRLTSGLYDSGVVSSLTIPATNINPNVSYTPLQLINLDTTLAINGVSVFMTPSKYFDMGSIFLSGKYIIVPSDATATANPSPVSPGSIITINSTNPSIGNINIVDIYYINPITGLPVTIPVPTTPGPVPNTVVITVPSLTGNPPTIVIIIVPINTPPVEVITFPTIYFTDGSGIYTLSSTQTHDNLYVNGTNVTVPLQFPTPFIKTGFLP